MKPICPLLLGLTLCVTALGETAAAQETTPKTTASTPAAKSALKTPQPTLQFDYSLRTRNDDSNNLFDLNQNADDQRITIRGTSRAGFSFKSAPVNLVVSLGNEIVKNYPLKPEQIEPYRFNSNEIFFDQLAVQFKRLPVKGLTVTAGRQNIIKGDSFMLADGTGRDGGRSAYFNAVLLSYKRGTSTYEVIGISDPRRERLLPILHSQHRQLNEMDEQGVVAYYSNRTRKNRELDGYYIYKRAENDERDPANYQFMPNRTVHAVGTRLSQQLPRKTSVMGELTRELGRQHADPAISAPAKDVRAWGGYLYAQKSFNSAWMPYIKGGTILLSGSDSKNPGTFGDFEMLFARRGKWSSLYNGAIRQELGSGFWTNNRMLYIEAGAKPVKFVDLRATLYSEFAFHPFTKNPAFISTGTHRGENLQLSAIITQNPSLNYRFLYERFDPGDFYVHRDASYLFRFQVAYQFNKILLGAPARASK